MSLWAYFLALFVLTAAENVPETSDDGIEEKTNVEEVLSAVRNQVDALKKRVALQDEEIKELTRHVEYLKMAGPKLGVLELMDSDDTLGEIASKKHSERFTHVTAVSLRVPKKERKNVPKSKLPMSQLKVRRNAVHVIVTVNTEQQIKLWDSEQNELAMVEPESSAKVTALLAATANQKAFLLAGFSDGHVLVYSITAWRTFDEETDTMALEGLINVFSNGMLAPWTPKAGEEEEEQSEEGKKQIDGKKEQTDSEEEGKKQSDGKKEQSDGEEEQKSKETKEEKADPKQQDELEENVSAVSTLGLNNRKQAKQFMVGYKNGYIRMYRRDGRMRKEVHSRNSSVLCIGWETDRNSVPIFTDSGFRFCKMSGLKFIGGFCPYKDGTQFTGYAFDTTFPNFLYIAYSDGRVVLHDAKKLTRKYLCIPKFEIEVEAGSPLHLETTEGYLLASSPTTLYIFNTSDVTLSRNPYLVEKRTISEDSSDSASFIGRMATTTDTYHHTLIVTTQLYPHDSCSIDSNNKEEGIVNGSSMVVYESYMKPKEKEKKEKGWAAMFSRTPILVIGFGLVMFMQFSGKGGSSLSKAFSGKRGRRGRRGNKGSRQPSMMDMQRTSSYGMPPRHMYED